jgi:hypothetical protein
MACFLSQRNVPHVFRFLNEDKHLPSSASHHNAMQQSMSQQQRFLPGFVIDRMYDALALSRSRLVDIAAFAFSVAHGGQFSTNV